MNCLKAILLSSLAILASNARADEITVSRVKGYNQAEYTRPNNQGYEISSYVTSSSKVLNLLCPKGSKGWGRVAVRTGRNVTDLFLIDAGGCSSLVKTIDDGLLQHTEITITFEPITHENILGKFVSTFRRF